MADIYYNNYSRRFDTNEHYFLVWFGSIFWIVYSVKFKTI